MSSSDSQSPRTCPKCQRTEPETTFYKKAAECRSCIRNTHESLEEQVEKHRRDKMLRQELKKIAQQRLHVRESHRRARIRKQKVEKLLPKAIPEESKIEVDKASKELAQRILERRRLIEFVKAFHPRYDAGWVHHDICNRLEKFAEDCNKGLSPRLMILMPPRHGKSQLASKLFPAWALGHYRHFEVMATSYNLSLALEFSREVRGVVRSERYKKLFEGTRLSSETQGAEAWKLASPTGVGAGGYIAAGIGGPITGKGAHMLIIDDPVKNAEEADSPEQREKIWNWYNSTAYTRLAPGGGVLIIQTWWHDDDLAGRLMQQMKEDSEADQFEIVKYPAIAEEDEEFRGAGEALHPERYDLAALLRIQRQLGGSSGRWWSALYQQNPVPQEGAYFKDNMFVWYTDDQYLGDCYLYSAWDFALGEKRVNDWTVGVLAAQKPDGRVIVLDMQRFRSGDQIKIADTILNHYQDHPNVRVIGVEDGQIWKGIEPPLKAQMLKRKLFPTLQPCQPLTDKLIRAQPLQGLMQQHQVLFPKNLPWIGLMHKELLRFPGGVHDDIVDALAWLARVILMNAPPKGARPPKSKAEKTVAEKIRELGKVGGGRTGMMAA